MLIPHCRQQAGQQPNCTGSTSQTNHAVACIGDMPSAYTGMICVRTHRLCTVSPVELGLLHSRLISGLEIETRALARCVRHVTVVDVFTDLDLA